MKTLVRNIIITLALGINCALAATWPNHFTTNQIPLVNWVSVKDFGAKGDGTTDDSVAVQAAIDSLTNNAVGGTVYFPDGVYFINSLFTETTGAKAGLNHSQLHLPVRDLFTQTIVSITLSGLTQPTLNTVWTTNSLPAVNTNGAIILSTRVPASPDYTIIGNPGPTGGLLDQTAVYLKLDKLTFRTYDNPKTTPLNLANVAQVSIRDCVVDTGTPGGAQTQPSAGTVGVILPKINNWVISEIYNMDVRGYDVCYQISEHSDVNEARAWIANYAWSFPGGTHAAHMGHTVTTGVHQGVMGGPPGFVQRIIWDSYAVEHSILTTNNATGSMLWANSVCDFGDTNSTLRGQVNFASVQSGVGASDTFVINNTTNVTFYNENNHSFNGVTIVSPGTNEPAANRLLSITDSNGVPVATVGHYPQPFQSFAGLWMGPQSSQNPWQLATNFTIITDSTNQTTINVGQPQGAGASNSVLLIQVGHVTVASFSNNVITFLQPLNHGYFGLSNIISGKLYTNTWWNGPIRMFTCVQLVKAAVAGSAAMQLRTYGFAGGVTNTVGDTTTVTTLADSGDFRMIEGSVPFGGSFTFTNTSVNGANSATLFPVQMQGD